MALFKRNTKADSQEASRKTGATESAAASKQSDATDAVLQPRVTEKAAFAGERGVYVFNVRPDANKVQVKQAIERMYNVTPRKVNMARVPSKQKRRGLVRGRTAEGKKAYVYLKEGDSIDIV